MTQAPPNRPLYALRILAPGHFALAKFSMPDFNVEATYTLIAKGSGWTCDCPASARAVKLRPCKHQRMLPFMMGAVNTDRFYEPEGRTWHQPLAPDLAAQIAQEQVEAKGIDGAALALKAHEALHEPVVSNLGQLIEPPKLRRRV